MISRFFRHPPFGFPLLLALGKRPVLQKLWPSARSFWTSSRLHQQYRYKRFGDPDHGPSQRGGGWSYFQSFWSRMTPGQRLLFVGVGGGAPTFYVTHLETVE